MSTLSVSRWCLSSPAIHQLLLAPVAVLLFEAQTLRKHWTQSDSVSDCCPNSVQSDDVSRADKKELTSAIIVCVICFGGFFGLLSSFVGGSFFQLQINAPGCIWLSCVARSTLDFVASCIAYNSYDVLNVSSSSQVVKCEPDPFRPCTFPLSLSTRFSNFTSLPLAFFCPSVDSPFSSLPAALQPSIVWSWAGHMWTGTAWTRCISTVTPLLQKSHALSRRNWDSPKVCIVDTSYFAKQPSRL